jgi:hypothetical protein
MNVLLQNQAEQLARSLNVAAQPVRDADYVHVSDRALGAPAVVGYRNEEPAPFTGWQIFATSELPEHAAFADSSVAELSAQRPEWLVGLMLPTGWGFRIVGHTLVDCVSPQGITHALRIMVELP